MLKFDGFDEAIVGMTNCWDGNERVDRLVYSGNAILTILQNDGMSEEEAMEYLDFNIDGAYVGSETPMIMWDFDETDL